MAIQHPEIKAHIGGQSPLIPKKRGLLEKGKGFLKSLAEKPKEIHLSDLKKDPWETIKQLVKNVPYVLGHATSKIGTDNKIIK